MTNTCVANWSSKAVLPADWSSEVCRTPKSGPGQGHRLAEGYPASGSSRRMVRCKVTPGCQTGRPGEPGEPPDIGSRLGHDRDEGSRCVTRTNGSSARLSWPTTGV